MTRLRILGTGNAQAVDCYNTCLAIENENGTMIVDAGGGNGILKILERENIELSNIHDIFVTHAHSDHIFGIFWLIRRIGETMNKGKMDGILTLYAHKELADFIIQRKSPPFLEIESFSPSMKIGMKGPSLVISSLSSTWVPPR